MARKQVRFQTSAARKKSPKCERHLRLKTIFVWPLIRLRCPHQLRLQSPLRQRRVLAQ